MTREWQCGTLSPIAIDAVCGCMHFVFACESVTPLQSTPDAPASPLITSPCLGPDSGAAGEILSTTTAPHSLLDGYAVLPRQGTSPSAPSACCSGKRRHGRHGALPPPNATSTGASVPVPVPSSTAPTALPTPVPAPGTNTNAHSKAGGGLQTVAAVLSDAHAVVVDPDAVTIGGAVVGVVSSHAGDVVAMASASGIVDMAGQALSGLLAVAARFPLGSQCCGLLKDMFALYQVCCTIT